MIDVPADGACLPCGPRLVLIDPRHPTRTDAEAFIAGRFRAVFGARATSTYPTIAALFDDGGGIAAAAGVRLAEEAPLFLERYLDEAVEQAVAAYFGRPVARATIVEIGGFAASDVSAAVLLFEALAGWLAGPCRRRYAVATVRPELARLLRRSGFDLRAVAEADPGRLGEAAAAWGTYYDAGPRIFVGQIGAPPLMPRLSLRLQARTAQQEALGPVERRS
jgi:hypothetical protein